MLDPTKAEWFAGAAVTNPMNGQILATSTPLAGSAYSIAVQLSVSASIPTVFQRISGGLTVVEVVLPPGGGLVVFPAALVLFAGDTVRVVARVDAGGEAQATLFVQPVS